VFRDAHDAYERAVAAAYAAANVRSTHTPEGLELLAPVSVGDYAIQPIKARGPESAQALNTWLAENGFSTVPVANMAYYLERRWVWLAIKANVSAVKGELRPLRVAFPSERVVYPLKFSTHQGVFDVTLWVFSAKPLRGFRRYGHAGSIPPLQGDHPAKAYGLRFAGHDVELPARLCGSTTLPRQVHLTKVTGRVNTPERPLAAWPNDLSLEP
jgi:hypothetical protein